MNNDSPKSPYKFNCEKCDYHTCRQNQYARHLSTDKHKLRVDCEMLKPQKTEKYLCECGKLYKYDSGYYRHKKVCNENKNKNKNNSLQDISPELILDLINDYKEMKQLILEQNNSIYYLAKFIEQKNKLLNNNI